MKRKIGMYFLSLWLMFILIIIITIKIPFYFKDDWAYIGTSELLISNIVPIICFLSIIISIIAFQDFRFQTQGTMQLSFKITEIDNIDYEHLTFLTTYIVPLVCFNFDNERYQVVLFILLFVIGVIYIRTDLFYANPTLAVFQFRIYKVSGCFSSVPKSNIVLITREKLKKEDLVKYVKLDDRIFYATKTTQ